MPTTEDQQTQQSAPKDQESSNNEKQENSDKNDAEEKDEPKKAQPMSPAKKTGLIVIMSVVVLLLIIGIGFWFLHASTYEETDDAQVNGHLNTIAARVEGTVTGVHVENNHYVSAGQPLVDLDAKDFQIEYDRTKAQLLQAQLNVTATRPNLSITQTTNRTEVASSAADVASARALVAATQHDVATAEARLRQEEANNLRAKSDLARYKTLVDKDEVSQQQYDQYLAMARAEQAAVEADEAAVLSVKQTVLQRNASLRQQEAKLTETTANGPRQEAIRANDIRNQEAGVAVAQSALERNQLNLTYTHITSPVAGIVMLRSAEIGDRVSVGQRLMQIVQIDNLWVDANFKETQLRKMRPGQKVTVKVDSLKENFDGVIDAMPAATGDRASLFPAENATGNYVKVVQRLPVRIRLNAGQKDLEKLRPGMSVEPKVSLD
jgi:membrane fusion protein (multidrug efflux system)